MTTWAEEHKGVVGASEAGHCLRAIGYRLSEAYAPDPLPDKARWAMERGKALEAVVAEMLRAQEWEVKVPNPPAYRYGDWLVAHPDRIATRGGRDRNCQIKVVNSRHFAYLSRGVRENGEAYFWQVQAEMAATGLAQTLFAVCRADDMALHTEAVEFDRAAWVMRAGVLHEVRNFALEGTLNPPEYAYPDWHCTYCDYLSSCQPDAKAQVLPKGGLGEVAVPDGADPITAVKGEYLEVLAEEKVLTDRKEALRQELVAFAEGTGANQVLFLGLTGTFLVGRHSLDANAAKKLLTPDQVKQCTKEGRPYWTWRATGEGE